MDPEDTNVYAPNIIDEYENHQDNPDHMCLADFADFDYTCQGETNQLIECD